MAKAMAIMAMVAVGTLGAGRSDAAAPLATVVLHVADYQKVSDGELAEAQQIAARAYARIGVHLVWTVGSARQAAVDGAVHLDVFILTAEMITNKMPETDAFGHASRVARRAYIYYPRIVKHAMLTSGDPARLLAVVLAHEVGHMLLPEHSHATSGLMRASLAGRIVNIPDFMPAQAATIRTLLDPATD